MRWCVIAFGAASSCGRLRVQEHLEWVSLVMVLFCAKNIKWFVVLFTAIVLLCGEVSDKLEEALAAPRRSIGFSNGTASGEGAVSFLILVLFCAKTNKWFVVLLSAMVLLYGEVFDKLEKALVALKRSIGFSNGTALRDEYMRIGCGCAEVAVSAMLLLPYY